MGIRIPKTVETPVDTSTVRTFEAIHLASALFLRQSFPGLAIVTTDDRIRANAALLGFEVEIHRP